MTDVLPTALAALFGAWAGAQFALTRFKQERAFDAQLDWYRSTARHLLDAAAAASEASMTLAHPPPQATLAKVLANSAGVTAVALTHLMEGELFSSVVLHKSLALRSVS